MLTLPQRESIAHQIKDAQDKTCQIQPFSSRVAGFDLATAYAVADLVHEERIRHGMTPVGRKIGFTNPDMWSLYGVREPIWAHVYDATVVHVGSGEASCSLARFAEPKIEPEIVVHFLKSPPPGADAAAILGCVDWIALGFEIVQSHFPGWKFTAADTVADWALHGSLFVGQPRSPEHLGRDVEDRLKSFTLSLFRDDIQRETGAGVNVLGSPLLAVSHLIAVLQKQARHAPLRPGELVTTGTITTAHSVRPGERWHALPSGIDLPGPSIRFLA